MTGTCLKGMMKRSTPEMVSRFIVSTSGLAAIRGGIARSINLSSSMVKKVVSESHTAVRIRSASSKAVQICRGVVDITPSTEVLPD